MDPGLVRSDLQVPAVEPQALRQPLELLLPDGESPLQGLWLGSDGAGRPPSRTELERLLPRQVGGLVLRLLNRGLQVRCGPGELRPLSPSDICLLVSRHDQAEALRGGLEERGIASRLVSQGDVFESEGAATLQRLLDALAEPGSGQRQRLLAASPLLGWSPHQLAVAAPAEWDGLADRVARLAAALPDSGLLAVLSELLGGDGLVRLSAGGRLLADVQQAAELVQDQMHRERMGAATIADWLRRRRLHPPGQTPESHQPHSVVEAAAVGVVTVHRSKGLEFPVVICPYLWEAPQPSTSGSSKLGCRWMPPAAAAPLLDLHANRHWGEGRRAAHQAWLAAVAEAERLAYVAVTRAMHLLVLAYGPAANQGANPLLPWLFPQLQLGPPRAGDQPGAGLGPGDALGAIQWLPLEADLGPSERWSPPAPEGVLGLGPRPERQLDSRWGRSSYSSWTHGGGGGLGPEALEEGRETDALSPPGEPSLDRPAAEQKAAGMAGDPLSSAHGPLEAFPRGATAGDALHRILERVDHGHSAADDPSIATLVEHELERAGIEHRHGPAVLAALDELRLTPMGGPLAGFRLADLPIERRLNELNFDLPLSGEGGPLVRSSGLAAVFRNHPGGSFGVAYASRLATLAVASRGFLTGSIDLVFTAPDPEGQERWWVADWKSNWLGSGPDDNEALACGPLHYGAEAMADLMAANHYPLQAHLYLVALHRYLGWRLADYRPERHLGGSVYVFLRGVPGAAAAMIARRQGSVPGMVVEPVALERLLALDALLREGQP
jgi:exodeoxyribonuclease V beta subunit